MTDYQRLIKFIKHKKIDELIFIKMTNLNRDRVKKYLKGGTKPTIDFIKAVFKAYPEINIHWWIIGEGEMLKGEQVPSDSRIMKEKEFQAMQADLKKYLEEAFGAVQRENKLLKKINDLQAENTLLKEKLRQMEK